MISTLPQALELLAQKNAQIVELTAQKDAQIGELSRKIESLQRQLTTLQHQIEQMLRRLYGRKSEKINPNQLMFDSMVIQSLEQTGKDQQPETPGEQEVKTKTRKTSQHHGRIPIPEHLERVEILLDIPEEQKICPETGNPLKVIGVEVSEKLEYRPGKLIVNVYKRPQYASTDESESSAGILAAYSGPFRHPIPFESAT